MLIGVITERQRLRQVILGSEVRAFCLNHALGLGPLASDDMLDKLLADKDLIPKDWQKVGHFYHFMWDVHTSHWGSLYTRYLSWHGDYWEGNKSMHQGDVFGPLDFVVVGPP